MQPHERIREAVERAQGPAIVAFLTAGYPEPDGFLTDLKRIAAAADAVEIGVPFSDPMADGVTIQRSSRSAIEHGVSLTWIFDQLAQLGGALPAPVLLMSYLNPLLAFGYERLAARSVETGVGGFIVPDLPFDESGPLRETLAKRGLALVQLVTPSTPPARLTQICAASSGFVYAVTRAGITGSQALPAELEQYLDRVKQASTLPVCAGFGVREPRQVATIGRHADGVIVGSALVEVLERGEDPGAFLRGLKSA